MLQDGIGSLVNPPWVSHPRQKRFVANKLGSGEFLLVKQGTEDVKMVVRTINSSAFTQADWDEYVVTVRTLFQLLIVVRLTERDHTTITRNPKLHGTGPDLGELVSD
jgi:hypothetical protein